MRPTDTLMHKRIMMQDAQHTIAEGEAGRVRDLAELLREVLPDADTIYVSPEMNAVARRAAETIPRHELKPSDPPSEHGFLIWDGAIPSHLNFPDATIPIRGMIWTTETFSNRGVWDYRDGADISGPTDEAEDDRPPDRIISGIEITLIPIMLVDGRLIPGPTHSWMQGEDFTSTSEEDPDTSGIELSDMILATWLLMGQTIANVQRAPAERHERKRAHRLGIPPIVTVVRLRHFSEHPHHDQDSDETPWSHRWLVGGHWRNQWHPSDNDHELIWIDPYVKGPKHLPLLVKDKIKALIR